MVFTIYGNTIDDEMPRQMPVMSIAAANIPAVDACWGATICGA